MCVVEMPFHTKNVFRPNYWNEFQSCSCSIGCAAAAPEKQSAHHWAFVEAFRIFLKLLCFGLPNNLSAHQRKFLGLLFKTRMLIDLCSTRVLLGKLFKQWLHLLPSIALNVESIKVIQTKYAHLLFFHENEITGKSSCKSQVTHPRENKNNPFPKTSYQRSQCFPFTTVLMPPFLKTWHIIVFLKWYKCHINRLQQTLKVNHLTQITMCQCFTSACLDKKANKSKQAVLFFLTKRF